LPALVAAAFLILISFSPACTEEKPAGPALRSRVAAVRDTAPAVSPESWCEVYFNPSEAPRFELPPLAQDATGGGVPVISADRWVWLNLWATWCGPCIREMEVLSRWKENLNRDGVKIDFWFLSLDEEVPVLSQFLQAHKGVPPGKQFRVAAVKDMEAWFKLYKLDSSTAIPIQVLSAPGGKVRCVRVGGLNEVDYRMVRSLLQKP